MELKVYKDTVTAAESICDTKLELPVETEMLIPDYLPQVFKIVKCFVYLVVLQKQVTAGRLTVDGYLRCVVYYQSEGDESLCQAEQKLPFTKQVDVKPGSWGPATVLVSGETEYVNCRAVNQRRVDVRGAFALSIEAVAEAQGEVITALAGGGIQQRTTSLTGSKAVGSQEKLITAEESIAFDAPPEMVLSTQCTGAVNEVKLVSGKVVLKGEIRAEVVYRTAPGHTLVHTTRQIPFNEILDVEGAAEDCQCFAVVQPTGCTITGGSGEDEGENTISATAALYVKVYRPVEYMAVSDAFSTESETVLTQQQVALEEVADVFTQQVEAVTTGQLPDENARIIDVMATPLPMEVIEQDGEAVLRGRVMAHLLCINALEEIDCYDKVCEYTLPRRYPRPAADVLTQQQVALEEVADVFTQQVEAVTTGQLPDENARIIDVMATPLPMEVIEQDGEAVLRGRVMAHLLCINALEEIDCYDKVCEYTLPRRYPRPAADVIAQCYPSVGSVSARKVGDDTSAAIVLTVRGIVSFRSTQTVLADVQCTSPLVRDDGDIALRIYFAQAGEDMFDIAKRYAASPEAIAAANDTGSGILEAPQRLLIPSAT